MEITFKYPMNIVAKDKISGFKGLLIARYAHISGCAQYGLAPQELSDSNTTKQTEYFDESRIEVIDNTGAVYEENMYDRIFTIALGTEVRDKVTNFQGKVVIAVENLHNCNQYYIQPPVDKDNKIPEGYWVDEGRLIVLGEGIKPEEITAPKRGSVFSRDLPKVR